MRTLKDGAVHLITYIIVYIFLVFCFGVMGYPPNAVVRTATSLEAAARKLSHVADSHLGTAWIPT